MSCIRVPFRVLRERAEQAYRLRSSGMTWSEVGLRLHNFRTERLGICATAASDTQRYVPREWFLIERAEAGDREAERELGIQPRGTVHSFSVLPYPDSPISQLNPECTWEGTFPTP